MKAELITDIGAAAGIEDDWRALAVEQGNAFLTPEWFRSWVGGDESQQPMIAAVRRDGGELAGVLPLALDDETHPRAVRFGGSRFGDRFGIACTPGEESEVAAAAMPVLEAALPKSAIFVLHKVEAGQEWPAAFAAASGRKLAVVEQSRAEQPHVSVAGLDWDGYLAQRSRKFRQRVARGLEKTLEQQGIEWAVRETGDASAFDADVDTLFHLHDLRRAEAEDSISDPAVRDSLTAFARAALDLGWLRLRILDLDRKPAAAYLAWHMGTRYAVYQSGFDPAFAEQSAGMFLLNDTVKAAIGEDAGEVDFLLGGEPYKWRFAPDPRVVRTVMLVGAMRPARLLVSAEAAARRHGRGLAQRKGIGRVLRAIARLLPGGRS